MTNPGRDRADILNDTSFLANLRPIQEMSVDLVELVIAVVAAVTTWLAELLAVGRIRWATWFDWTVWVLPGWPLISLGSPEGRRVPDRTEWRHRNQ